MSENELREAKEYNVRIYPYYKMVSWDLLFFYSIIYLFLTQARGLSTASILLGDSFYPLAKIFFQIPFVTIVDKIGKRKSLLLGNILLTFSVLILIIFNGLACLIISNIVMAAAFTLKGLCESTILDECISLNKSILNEEKRREIFSSLDGRGSSLWYFFNAISSIITGFLFVVNAYIPMILSIILCIISCIISYKFKNYESINTKNSKESEDIAYSIKQLKYSFKFIFKSNRLRNLVLFGALFSRFIRCSFNINK